VVICVGRGAGYLHMVQLMPLHLKTPHHLLPHLNPDWFFLSGTCLPRLFWKRGYKMGVVVVAATAAVAVVVIS